MLSTKKPLLSFVTLRNASLIFLAAYVFHVVMITFLIKDEWNRTLFNDLAFPIEGLIAVAALSWGAWRSAAFSRQLFAAWGLLTLAQLAWTLGDINWFVLQIVLKETSFPSLTDVCYLVSFTLFIVGVLKLPMQRLKGSEWLKFSLDMGIVALSAVLIFWYFWIGPFLRTGVTDLTTLIVAFTYPTFEFLLIMTLFLLLARRLKTQALSPVILLMSGVLLKIITDVVFGYQFSTETYFAKLYVDMGWIATVLLAGLAGVFQAITVEHSATAQPTRTASVETGRAVAPWAMYAPYFWLVGAYILLVRSYGRDLEIEFSTLVTWVGAIMLLVVIRQITAFLENKHLLEQQQRIENALRESERQYRRLFENSLDAIFTVDLKGNFTSANKATETVTGYTRDELIGKNYRGFMDKELAERLFHLYNDLYRTRVPISGTRFEMKRKGGDERIIEGYTNLIQNVDEVIGFQGTLRDVTDRVRLEQQLVQAQKMEAVGTMAGGIAHNFNNIMVGITGYAEFLLMKKTQDDPDYKGLTIIHESALRASDLTRQILNISRGAHHNAVSVNLNNLIEKIMPLITGTFDKLIHIKTHLEDGLMSIEGDINQLEQCLFNLSINARDAMPQGGQLIIETKNQVLDEDFVQSHLGCTGGPHVVLSVTDIGTGISPEIRDHIFEPFFTTKKDSGGSGIGLATVYGIMRSHSGFITVYSEVGKGTTFKLYFPAAKKAARKATRKNETADHPVVATILLIDDESVVREVWGDFLTQKGHRVLTAENGLVGIELFKRHKDEIDLVILDLIMPELGGKATLTGLREIDPSVKVLVTSGYSENGQAGEILPLEIDAFIQKPAPLGLLQEKIGEILGK